MTLEMPRPGLIHRAAAAICPPGQRQWVHAMFAELSAIDGSGRRTTWALGAAAIVLSAVEGRALTMLAFRMRVAIGVALGAALGCGILSYTDAGAVHVDDDLLAAISVTAAASLGGLAFVAARKIFGDQEFAANEG